MKNTITCPSCQSDINVEDVLTKRIEAEFQQKLNIERQQLQQKTQELAEKEENITQQVQSLVIKEKEALTLKVKNQLAEESASELNLLKKEVQEKSTLVSKLKAQEGDLLKEKRQLEEREAGLQAEVEKQLTSERAVLETQIKERLQNDSDQKLKEKDLLINQLNSRVNDMKQKMDQGSTQVQGEAQELIIAEKLTSLYPFDLIQEIKTGANGADVSQTVRNNYGQICGSILYESKNTKNFSESWITKLKEDMLREKAEIGVIITRAMPDNIKDFTAKETNIYVCSLESYKALSSVLRNAILTTNEVRLVQQNQGEKTTMLYNYLLGAEFKQQLQVVHDTFVEMHDQLQKDKKQAIAGFSKREKQIDKIMLNLAAIAGNINGISGQNVAEWAEFEEVEKELKGLGK
jgi:hypothetical protein